MSDTNAGADASPASQGSPIRSRSTPMNYKKAMPANGMRFSAIATAVRRRGSVSHAPAAPGWAGTESLSSTNALAGESAWLRRAVTRPGRMP